MRFVLTALLWLVTTVLLAVAVPAAWAQQNLVDADGYARFTQDAGSDPGVQQAVAAVVTTQVVSFANSNGYDVPADAIGAGVSGYTRSSSFPGTFATANRIAHRWAFTDAVQQSDSSGRWVLDLTPMVQEGPIRQALQVYGIQPPSKVEIPLTEYAPQLRPGQLQQFARWGPWVSVAAAVLAGVFALLTLAAARGGGKALAALGVSALLVGAAGWAGLEVGRRYLNTALNATSGDIRGLADALLGYATASMHQYLNITLAAGAGLVVLGVLVALLGSLRKN